MLTPPILVSLRCVSSPSAAWCKGVLSIPGKGRAQRRIRPSRYFIFQGVKELNFSDGKRTEDQTSSLVTSLCWDRSSSPAQPGSFIHRLGEAGGEQQPVGARGAWLGTRQDPRAGLEGEGRVRGVMVPGTEGAPGGLSLSRFQKRDCSKRACPSNTRGRAISCLLGRPVGRS